MFRALGEIEAAVSKQNKNYYEVILEDDCKEQGITKEASFEKMKHMYQMMQEADLAYDKKQYSASGLVGTDGEKMAQARAAKTVLCGDFIGEVMEKAIKMGESNACMKRIVAAPTAGSCGVIDFTEK